MNTATASFSLIRVRCHWRPVIMVAAGLALLCLFWFAYRYPQLFSKAEHLGQGLPSMAYSSQLMVVAANDPVWLRILAATVNWLDSMKIGMTERFTTVFGELAGDFGKHVWMLLKPTLTIMLLASVVSATLLVLIPWGSLLSEVTPLRLALVSLLSVFMPVPIALDVMFAAQLHQQGAPAGYVMTFAMTLGTYSIIPSIYLWREVSKSLAVSLAAFFLILGWILGLVFWIV